MTFIISPVRFTQSGLCIKWTFSLRDIALFFQLTFKKIKVEAISIFGKVGLCERNR
jgi:hypothetical protein